MLQLVLFAVGASAPLIAGGALGAVWRPPRHVVAVALAYAAGALVSALSFDLFKRSYETAGAVSAGLAFAVGATVFVAVDTVLDSWSRRGGRAAGFALLASVTLDGVPENTALGVSLVGGGSYALLVAIFTSNFPEALAGAADMRDRGRRPRAVILLWGAATVLLALSVVAGRYLFDGASPDEVALPLAFAAGAVLASVVATLAPEAFGEGGPLVGIAAAAGFLTSFMITFG